MITELTPEQEAQLQIYAKKWRDIGLSTEPANRLEAEKGVRLAYELAGLKSPKDIVWFESPYEFALSQVDVSNKNSIRKIVWVDVIHPIIQEFYWSVNSRLHKFVFLDFQRGNPRWYSVEQVVWRSIDESLEIVNGDNIQKAKIYHRQEARIIGSCIYFSDIVRLGIDIAPLEGVIKIVQNAGWWMPYLDICYILERHNILNLDDQDRPHCEDGLAIGYPDGWGMYAWHGVRVPEWVILRPQDITPDNIMSEENTEIARVMLERYGQDNFIRDGGFSQVQSDDYGELYRVDFKNGDEPIVAVKVKDASTDREYFLYVPPHITSAHEGVAWTFGYDNVSDYNPDKET